MKNVGTWVLGAAASIMAVAALFVAARAGHGLAEYAGLGVFAFCVLFVFLLMKSSFDHADRGHR
jgi:hypothetical protein